MLIKAIYATQDEIPEQFRELFEEREGKYFLTKIEGIKTDADVNRVQRALSQEKQARVELQQKFDSVLNGKTPEELQAVLDKLPELEAAAGGKIDDEKINTLVEARIKSKLAPLERERDQLKTQASEFSQKIADYQNKERQRTVHDNIREAATKVKVLDTAVEDVLLLGERIFEVTDDGKIITKDNVGVTPGIGADVWLTEMQSKRPHWWPASNGGGARGSGASGFSENPWSGEHWNMTKQTQIYRENPAKAEQYAKAAGTTIGGQRPALKK